MALIRINGHLHHFNTDEIKIKKVSNGRWEVTYDRGTFLVVGGIKSGGSKREWFCYHPEFYGEEWVFCNSMIAAIKLGVVY